MDEARIERYVSDLLTVSGVEREGKEQGIGLALYHLLMSACMYEQMSAEERGLLDGLSKKLQYFFSVKFALKERKRKTEKKIIPPNPLLKEKEKKEKEEKMCVCVADRKEAFHQECLGYVGQFDAVLIENFFNYYSQVNKRTGKMWFETVKFWDTENRLKLWANNQFSNAIITSSIRLQHTKEKQAKEQVAADRQQSEAQERERANAELERRIEESKAGAVSREEWLAMKAAGAAGGQSPEAKGGEP